MTEKETLTFFEAVKKNNIPILDKPRTQEEIKNLKVVYNKKSSCFYIVNKDKELNEVEIEVPTKNVFDLIMNKEVSEYDEYSVQ